MASRKVWFITRPERDPKFHKEALSALKTATNDFTKKWTGSRETHKEFEKELNRLGIKRNNISSDGSGGRTWTAMLRTFSYCYINRDGFLVPTKAGLSIINGVKVYENIKKQILTLQIPNAYFLEPGFRPKFDKEFAIRPCRFLIKLCSMRILDYYATKEEITFFALTAKKDSELLTTAKAIKNFRESDEHGKRLIKQQIAAEHEHRERSDKGARDFESANSDVAHTFMLICEYTGMVDYIRGEALRMNPEDINKTEQELSFFDERYPFNKRYLISLERMAENNGLDVDSYKASRYGDVKPAANRTKTEQKIKELLKSYPNPASLHQEELKRILQHEFPPKEAEKIAYSFEGEVFSGLNNEFVESYLNEQDNSAFEDKTGEIFKAIGFDVEMRPKPIDKSAQTEIEIILKYGKKHLGIIDAKNYKDKFSLSAGLASHMASEYIPNYEGYEGREITFFGYVTAAGFTGQKNLTKINRLAQRAVPEREIKGIMINARVLLGFLDYCIEKNIPKNERIKLFLKAVDNKAYFSLGDFLKHIH